MGVGVVGTDELGVENGDGRGQHLVLHMVVAHDEVNAQLLGIGNLIHCLHAAVEYDNELHAGLLGIVNPLERHAIPVVVAVGDVVVDVGGELL